MPNPNEKIEHIDVSVEMSRSFLDYSMSVIISRALPDARDGLKPSQRRILYAMHDLSLFPGRQHRKCAKICGDTSGNYHPHGEAVIYPTLVHMAQPWVMRERLIDGQGNFGSVEGDPPAAMRYTEARLTHLGAALMEDMEKDTVNFVTNYDETTTEPTCFPGGVPEPARQRRHRHRRRHGHEHPPAQSRRGHRRRVRAGGQPRHHHRGNPHPHQGAGFSHGLQPARPVGHPFSTPRPGAVRSRFAARPTSRKPAAARSRSSSPPFPTRSTAPCSSSASRSW